MSIYKTEKQAFGELQDTFGNLIDVSSGGLEDLVLKTQNLKLEPPQKPTIEPPEAETIPEEYKGKKWRDLYLTGELEIIKNKYPQFFHQLKTEFYARQQ